MAMTRAATCILPIEVIVLDYRINGSLRYVIEGAHFRNDSYACF
jgi:hypothetical protein